MYSKQNKMVCFSAANMEGSILSFRPFLRPSHHPMQQLRSLEQCLSGREGLPAGMDQKCPGKTPIDVEEYFIQCDDILTTHSNHLLYPHQCPCLCCFFQATASKTPYCQRLHPCLFWDSRIWSWPDLMNIFSMFLAILSQNTFSDVQGDFQSTEWHNLEQHKRWAKKCVEKQPSTD